MYRKFRVRPEYEDFCRVRPTGDGREGFGSSPVAGHHRDGQEPDGRPSLRPQREVPFGACRSPSPIDLSTFCHT
jgi:hypothetical protein